MNIVPRMSRRLFLRTSLGAAILAGASTTARGLAHPATAQAAVAAITSVVCSSVGACVTGSNSSSGDGVLGSSKSGDGLYGESTSGIGTFGYSSGYIGVYGDSSSGTGTTGYSYEGNGLYGLTEFGIGLRAQVLGSGTGAFVYTPSGYGIISYSNGYPALFADNLNNSGYSGSEIGGEIIGQHIGLDAEAPASGGFPLVARDTAGNDLFYVNGAGAVYAKGGYNSYVNVSGGHLATAFGSRSTAPTIEDTGTGRLVAGAATVALDPTFAAAIDPHATYHVVVTPNGDTRGLFVATKTATGFIVRESQAGHSTVTFDYRVIGSALGQSAQRMAIATSANAVPPLTGALVLPHAPASAPAPPPVRPH